MADINDIILKVRRLTRSPSTVQLSDADIVEYVNTFILYDFPGHLRISTMRKQFSFYTAPYVGEYNSNNAAAGLFDFKNEYISIHEPIFIDGKRIALYQDRELFFNDYPNTSSRTTIATGDGITLNFVGNLSNVPITNGSVSFSAIDINNAGAELHDVDDPIQVQNLLIGTGAGNIDYITGAYVLNFIAPPAANESIVAHTVPYRPSIPTALLFFNNTFTVRPIPDQVYKVNMEAYKRPIELGALNLTPELEQWWQYISYGAAKKVFEDRSDREGIATIMPEFKQQEKLVLRKTLMQMSNERAATIYCGSNNISPF